MTRAKDDPRFHRLMGCLDRQLVAELDSALSTPALGKLLDHLRGNLADSWPALMDLEEEPTAPGPWSAAARGSMVPCPACRFSVYVSRGIPAVECPHCTAPWAVQSTAAGVPSLHPINEWSNPHA